MMKGSTVKKFRLSSAHVIPLSFLAAILIGTVVLTLPVCSAQGTWTSFLTALFTAATSVCVTGLVVVDTYSYWSVFGQFVILILIQIGGLGIITVVSLLMFLSRKQFSLGDRLMLQEALNLNTVSGVVQFMLRIIRGTLLVELAGALLYALVFVPEMGPVHGFWVSAFTAISAFCNAGIDIIGPVSLAGYQTNGMVLCVTMILIILGGLGFVVWFDVLSSVMEGVRKKLTLRQIFSRFSVHTKAVICLTAGLIVFGTAAVFATEYNNPETLGTMSAGYKFLNSLFESVTLRTAGFSTFSQQGLRSITCIPAGLLMFIGGSPIGTAGGVKTMTVFLVFMNVHDYIRGRNRSVVFQRTIAESMMKKALAILSVAVLTVLALTYLLMLTNSLSLTDSLFEVISACATVGLSRNITAGLNAAGRLIIIIGMYLGRIGPVSMAFFIVSGDKKGNQRNYAEGNFYVG